jgi:YggT family protein
MVLFLTVIRVFLQIITFAILIRAVLSWIMPGQRTMLTDIIYHITEPILAPIRKILPSMGTIDLSPLIAIIILQVISFFIP